MHTNLKHTVSFDKATLSDLTELLLCLRFCGCYDDGEMISFFDPYYNITVEIWLNKFDEVDSIFIKSSTIAKWQPKSISEIREFIHKERARFNNLKQFLN